MLLEKRELVKKLLQVESKAVYKIPHPCPLSLALLDSSPKGRAKNAAGKLLPLPSGEVARR